MDASPMTESKRTYLDRAFDQYVETADWADAPRDENGEESDTIGIHPEALATMRADVEAFIDDEWDDVRELSPEDVGHNFWLTRNRHGAGFWDRGLGELGDRLTAAAHVYGECWLYVGDDGWTYAS